MRAEQADRSKRLLVLGAGPAQLGLLEAAKARGFWIAVADRDPSAPGFVFADRRCIVSTEDEPALERLAAALELDGLIAPGSDRPVAAAARIAEKLGLRHPLTAVVAARVGNKLRQREALSEGGVPQPRWQVVSEGDEGLGLSFPVVVKAPDRTGQDGMRLVHSARELPAAIAVARSASRGSAVLVEEYVDGPEVIVSGFSVANEFVPLSVIDVIGPAIGLPLALVWPSPHAEAATEVSRRAIDALGIDEGPSHIRLRISRGGPEVIKVAARLGGGDDTELVELVSGIDLNGLGLAAALGQPVTASEVVPSSAPTVGAAATRFLLAPPGRLESVEVSQGLKGVVTVRMYRDPGHVFKTVERVSDRAGAVLAVGSTRAEAVARVEDAAERIRFVTVDPEAAAADLHAAVES